MHAFCRTNLVVTILVSVLAVGCGDDPVAPSLSTVDESTVLLTDNFDTENGAAGFFNWTSFANWNVLAGCVDLHGNGFVDVQPGKGLYVDLDGSCDAGGTIETKAAFTLQPGNYVLEYWIAGNQRIDDPDTVSVSLGSVFQEQFVVQKLDRFELRTRNFSVPSTTTVRLRFQNAGGDGRGALVDLVRLRRS
jgi:hypothetical protein